MVNIGINGICGRMGKRILRLAQADESIKVLAGFEKEGHPELGKSIEGVDVFSGLEAIQGLDCVIDFTSPEATGQLLELAKKYKKSLVIGTTGLSEKEEDKIKAVSGIIPVVYSPNMSIGINLFFKILKTAASVLKGYEAQIKEAHHIHKKDAPSGTAKKLAQIINQFGSGIKKENIEAIREGEIIGDHQVLFDSSLDCFKIIHQAKTRDIFAQGALTAAKWIKEKPAGLYSMEDVLFG